MRRDCAGKWVRSRALREHGLKDGLEHGRDRMPADHEGRSASRLLWEHFQDVLEDAVQLLLEGHPKGTDDQSQHLAVGPEGVVESDRYLLGFWSDSELDAGASALLRDKTQDAPERPAPGVKLPVIRPVDHVVEEPQLAATLLVPLALHSL